MNATLLKYYERAITIKCRKLPDITSYQRVGEKLEFFIQDFCNY